MSHDDKGSMATEKLYHADPFLVRFEARLVRKAHWQGLPSIVLDKTALRGRAASGSRRMDPSGAGSMR
jgi:hypothetical protein